MRRLTIILTLIIALVTDIHATNGGSVQAGHLYSVPTGNFDIDYTTSETIEEGQTVVVFYYTNRCIAYTSRNFAFGTDYKEFSYVNERDTADNLIIRFYDTRSIVKPGRQLLINLYSPLEENASWAYVICDEAEKQTIANPFAKASDSTTEALPGQTEATAIEIGNAPIAVTAPVSKITSTEYTIYTRFTAPYEGRAYINMPEGDIAHYIKAEGSSYKMFAPENGYPVEENVTYYVWYRYTESVKGAASVDIERPQRGESRSTAIGISGNAEEALLGKASIGNDYFYNTTTWFVLNNDSLTDKGVMTIRLDGGNKGHIALYDSESIDPIKSYFFGEGSGMLAVGTSVDFDITPATHTYYVAITQDNVGGVATFTFSEAAPGQTIGTAIQATIGKNTATANNWYKYTHTADNIISITNVSTVYDANEGLVAAGEDVTFGFRMTPSQTVYFQANRDFEIKATDIPQGTVADKPLVLTLDNEGYGQFNFNLNGSNSDATRYILYEATQTGTLMYGTSNDKVITMAFGSSVIDQTTGRRITVRCQSEIYDTPYYTYTFQVVAGHTYLIEQTLANNLGTVNFMAVFTPAQTGEVMDMPIALAHSCAYDLGRTTTTPRYFRFVAPQAGDYLLSVHAQGYVRRYLSATTSYAIQRDYTRGTDFHNETTPLAKGDTILLSVETTADIEHIAVDIQDFFIPNYYIVCSLTNADDGTTIEQPLPADTTNVYEVTAMPQWYGPINVPAGETLTVTAIAPQQHAHAAIVHLTDEKGQWINNQTNIVYDLSAQSTTHTYTLRTASEERTVYVLTSPTAAGSHWSLGDKITPVSPITLSSAQPQRRYNLLGQPSHGHGIVITQGKKVIKK